MPLRPVRLIASIITLVVGGGALWARSSFQGARPPSLADADRLYREKSFAGALKGYESAAKSGGVPAPRRQEVRYRIAVCLGKSLQWDRAAAESLAFVKENRGSVWEARGLYWLGRLYIALPHQGYRVGPRLYRGQNVPKAAASDKPRYIDVSQQDSLNARDAFEAARVLYPRFRELGTGTRNEEIQLDFDLAVVLQSDPRYSKWASKPAEWAPPADPYWRIDPSRPYDLAWPTPKKALFLFAEIRALARGSRPDALALLAESMWLQRYHQMMTNYAVRFENDRRIPIPYPYQGRKPEEPLLVLISAFPNLTLRDQAQILYGSLLQQEQRYVEALRQYRNLIAVHPKSSWAEDARAAIDGITRRSLSVGGTTPRVPGGPVPVEVVSRNVKRIRYRIHKVRLENVIASDGKLRNPDVGWNQFGANFGSLKQAETRFGPLVRQWDESPADWAYFKPHQKSLSLSGLSAGAYALVASSADGSVRAATIVMVSDLVLVQKSHRDGILLYAANGRTGSPTAAANVIVKRTWNVQDQKGSWRRKAAYTRVSTDADGLAAISIDRKAGLNNLQVSAMGWTGSSYALTNPNGWYFSYSDTPATLKVYGTTDRSVYRPRQAVNYRQVVYRRTTGDLRPLVGSKVHVEIRNPTGEVILRRDAVTTEFGSASGRFDLPDDAPLGEYLVTISLPGNSELVSDGGASRFRVEEYKKPEFEVTVTPAAERVRLGQPTSAKIAAKYYFGGPVPGAKVSYRIHRSPYAQQYRFPRPFDFLWRYWGEGDYDYGFRNGPVIKQGEVKLDANGEAAIQFPTEKPGPNEESPDRAYTIEADVQDASRRVISGSGTVKATRHDVAAFLNYPHGYASKGDRLAVEIRTLNPSDQPVSVSGRARVYRVPEDPSAKPTLIHDEPLTTDSQGRGVLQWTADTSGWLRVAFETTDSEGGKVSGATEVCVQGQELDRGRFRREGVFLAAKNPYYEEGQTARVLLVTPEPGCTVLLTREANDEILEKRIVSVPGRSTELSIPVRRADVPNVYLNAILVRHGQMFTAQQELFVPPARQFATISVSADRARFQPGEKATLKLSAKDWRGRPLRTELSVSVSDAALNYIQKDYAPDIRAYLYGDRRSVSTESSGSPGVGFDSASEDSQPAPHVRMHLWGMPEGMGMLAEWPGGRQNQGRRYRGSIADLPSGISSVTAYDVDNTLVARYRAGDASSAKMAVMMPASAPMPARAQANGLYFDALNGRAESGRASDAGLSTGMPGMAGELKAPTLRTNFVDTAFWTPAVVTDRKGYATVQVTWPDNLTQWRANAIGTSAAAQVGSGETKVATKKDLIVRLQAPRFFVERDQVTLTANIQNYTDSAQRVRVKLDLGGDNLDVVSTAKGVLTRLTRFARLADAGGGALPETTPVNHVSESPSETWVEVPKDGESRVDWLVGVKKEGLVKVRMTAQSEKAADAAEMSFPVLVHGVERMTTQSGVITRGQQVPITLPIALPAARKPGSSELVVTLNPSLATVMLDALPYLADYPYGCVEQTMSRFLPSVVVAKTLNDLGYNLGDLRKRANMLKRQAAIARAGVRGVQANSPYTYPKGVPGTAQIGAAGSDFRRLHNPVFDEALLDKMVASGYKRLYEMQHQDGGWGWWPSDSSDPYMSAYVLYGLQMAKAAGYAVQDDRLARGLEFLKKGLKDTADLHLIAYEGRVLSMDPRYRDTVRPMVTDRPYRLRERLSAYSKALLAMALQNVGEAEKARVLLRNIETTAKEDVDGGTVHWEDSDRLWWCWWNDKVETNAGILEAYLRIDPKSRLLPMAAKWLVNNRRGDGWASTKETSLAVLALADYAKTTRELAPDYRLSVNLGGRVQRTFTVNQENALFFDNRFVVPDSLLETGSQPLTIAKNGPGTVYYSAYTRTFSLEEPLHSVANEIAVTRRYFRLTPGTAHGTPEPTRIDEDRPNPFLTGRYELLTAGGEWTQSADVSGGPEYDRTELKDGDSVGSGDLIDVDIELNSRNDYSYLVFEDLKPAGCEPVELRSGGKEGLGVYSNMELRDQKVAFFLSSLPQGSRTLTYRLRAEIPGAFHVLPTNGYAMYAPDVRALSDERHLTIRDDQQAP